MFLPDPPQPQSSSCTTQRPLSHGRCSADHTLHTAHALPQPHARLAFNVRHCHAPSPTPIRPTTQQLDTRTASDQSRATRQIGSPTARLGACRRRLLLLRQIGTLTMLGPPPLSRSSIACCSGLLSDNCPTQAHKNRRHSKHQCPHSLARLPPAFSKSQTTLPKSSTVLCCPCSGLGWQRLSRPQVLGERHYHHHPRKRPTSQDLAGSLASLHPKPATLCPGWGT